jgi:putative NADH-flavin reductase
MSRVCVTGASGYIAAYLVKKLLERGCVVHGTLRNLGDEKKTAPLRELPGAAERLVLFEADMYDADTFEPAIAGCEFVFLVATPLHHDPTSTKVCSHPSLKKNESTTAGEYNESIKRYICPDSLHHYGCVRWSMFPTQNSTYRKQNSSLARD